MEEEKYRCRVCTYETKEHRLFREHSKQCWMLNPQILIGAREEDFNKLEKKLKNN